MENRFKKHAEMIGNFNANLFPINKQTLQSKNCSVFYTCGLHVCMTLADLLHALLSLKIATELFFESCL